MKLWLEVTKDKYELPLAVADSAKELAQMVGTTESNVRSNFYKRAEKSRFQRIIVDDN